MKTKKRKRKDWTVGVDGRSNSSKRFDEIVDDVEIMLRACSLGDDLTMAARRIVARLAYVHRMKPESRS